MPRLVGSRSAPSCFEPHEIGDASFGTLRAEALSEIGHRGDCATTTMNVRKTRKAGDAEVRNSRPTLLQ